MADYDTNQKEPLLSKQDKEVAIQPVPYRPREDSDVAPPDYKENQYYQPPPQFGYDGYQNNHHGYQQGVPPQPGGPVRIVEEPPMAQQQQMVYNPVPVHRVEGSNHMEILALILSFGLCLLGSPCALCCTIPAYIYAKKARLSQDDKEREMYSKKGKTCIAAVVIYAIVAYVLLLIVLFISIVAGVLAGTLSNNSSS